MQGIDLNALEKGKFIQVNQSQFKSLMRQCVTSDRYRKAYVRIDWDVVFADAYEKERKEDLVLFQVYVGDMVSNEPIRPEGWNCLVLGDVKAPWVDLSNPLSCAEGGSFIVIGNVECEHFSNHWGKIVIVDGDLVAHKLLLNAFEDASLVVTRNIRTEYFFGRESGAVVGGTAQMAYGNGYCEAIGGKGTIQAKQDAQRSYAFLGFEEASARETDVWDRIRREYEE